MHVAINKLDANTWGQATWRFLHTLASTYKHERYSDAQRLNMRSFFLNLDSCIPCSRCQAHTIRLMRTPGRAEALDAALAANSPDLLVDWVSDLHNEVNRHLKKTTYSKVAARIENNRVVSPVEKNTSRTRLLFFIGGMLVGGVIAYLLLRV